VSNLLDDLQMIAQAKGVAEGKKTPLEYEVFGGYLPMWLLTVRMAAAMTP
jgi:hypothetical protein